MPAPSTKPKPFNLFDSFNALDEGARFGLIIACVCALACILVCIFALAVILLRKHSSQPKRRQKPEKSAPYSPNRATIGTDTTNSYQPKDISTQDTDSRYAKSTADLEQGWEPSEYSSNSEILPEWMSTWKTVLLLFTVLTATGMTIFFACYPFVGTSKPMLLQEDGKVDPTEPRTGLRAVFTLLHSTINAAVVLTPLLIWYFKNSCKVNGVSQKTKPLSQRTLFYSYSINDGWGQQIGSLGIAVSNILYALVIMFRFEYFRMISEKAVQGTNLEIQKSAIAMLFIGLSVRVFASMVPSLSVDTNKVLHYMSASMLFLVMGCYMFIEIWLIDPSINGIGEQQMDIVFRRILFAFYIFWFFGMGVFMKMELWAFSSISELSAMMCQELYLLTYIVAFRFLDSDSPFLHWETPVPA